MKKQLFLSSALALVALASCGAKKGTLKVGLICLHDNASTYDKNFITAFEASCKEAKQKGLIADYKYITDVPEEGPDCYNAAEMLVNQGYGLIFSDSFGHNDDIQDIAAEYPDVTFSSATGDTAHIAKLPNFHNAFASIYEGRYLAGVAAGEYLKESGKGKDEEGQEIKLGYVGAYPYAEVVSGYTSWYLGVKSTYEKATVTMQVEFTNSWYDEVKEGDAATKLIDEKKCILISQHADSMGAPNVCAAKHTPNVSYNMNTAEMSDVCKDTYIAHSRINWKPYYDGMIKAAAQGKKFDEDNNNWTGTLGTDSVQYNVSSLVSEASRAKVEDVAKKLRDGTLHVFDTSKFKVNNKKIETYKIDLDGDKTAETETVKTEGGVSWIQESVFRSAPYFDLDIDGITGRA